MIRDLDLGKKGTAEFDDNINGISCSTQNNINSNIKRMHEDVQRADVYSLVDKLDRNKELTKDEFIFLIDNRNYLNLEELYQRARDIRHKIYGHDVYLRGLIEFTSYCRNDCYYCGIRKSNSNAERYRLTKEQILSACEAGYALGYRTFVLQGGEDPYYDAERIADVVRDIRKKFPDCAITLSVGETTKDNYKMWYDAGAERYLLRHETANEEHYRRLHPEYQKLSNRMECLYNLRDIGYQVGAGFMVGSPYQTTECLADDLLFIKDLQPHMVGIGPFIPHHDTPFADKESGTLELTLFLLAILRIMLPEVLLPATTALGTISPDGREKGILAGANVVMPNLSPQDVRGKYLLYDNKICTGDEAAECRGCIDRRIEAIGYKPVISRGDHISKR